MPLQTRVKVCKSIVAFASVTLSSCCIQSGWTTWGSLPLSLSFIPGPVICRIFFKWSFCNNCYYNYHFLKFINHVFLFISSRFVNFSFLLRCRNVIFLKEMMKGGSFLEMKYVSLYQTLVWSWMSGFPLFNIKPKGGQRSSCIEGQIKWAIPL